MNIGGELKNEKIIYGTGFKGIIAGNANFYMKIQNLYKWLGYVNQDTFGMNTGHILSVLIQTYCKSFRLMYLS